MPKDYPIKENIYLILLRYFNGEVVQTVTGTNLGGLTPTEISNLQDSVVWPDPINP